MGENGGTLPENVRLLYENYQQQVEAIRRKAGPTDGLLGFSSQLKAAPCHDEFAQGLEQALQENAELTGEDAFAVVSYMIARTEESQKDQTLYFMMLAVQKYALPLVPCLTQEQAADLVQELQATGQLAQGLPPQKQLWQALRAQAGEKRGFGIKLNQKRKKN